MKNSKFKPGEWARVKKFEERPMHWLYNGVMDHLMGCIVKIKELSSAGDMIVYDPNWKCDWGLKESDVEKINNTIVIYQKGNQTIALNKVTGEKAVAKCHPDEEFNFEVGANLAFQRLFGGKKDEKDETLDSFTVTFKNAVDSFVECGFTSEEAIHIAIRLAWHVLKEED